MNRCQVSGRKSAPAWSLPCPAISKYSVIRVTGHTVKRYVAEFFALAGHFQMRHAATFMPGVADGELAQFLAPEGMVER